MGYLLLHILPLALGAAVSPMLLTIQVFTLASGKHAVVRGWVYTAGAALVLLLLDVIGGQLFSLVHQHKSWTGVAVKGAAAIVLLALAYRISRREAGTTNKLMTRLEGARTSTFVVIGLLAMVSNFSSIVLYVPAVHEIATSTATQADRIVAYAVLMIITLLPALLPVLAATVLGSRAQPGLDALNSTVSRHANQINMAICLFFAAWLAFAAVQEALALPPAA